MKKSITVSFLITVTACFALVSCGEEEQSAGETIEEAAEGVSEAIEEAGDNLGEAIDDVNSNQ